MTINTSGTDGIGWRAKWTVRKRIAGCRSILETVEIERNLAMNEGITEALKLIGGISSTAYSASNARLGVGDGGPSALTGTLSFTNGSTAVTGSGTAFTTELAVGDWIYPNAQGSSSGSPPSVVAIATKIQSIANDTSLTLASNFAGTTASGAASSKLLREIATQTDLQASTNKLYVSVTGGYPQVSNQTITWVASFAANQANFAWNEIALDNGSSAAKNLNRKISILGVKPNTQIWELQLDITLG